MLKKDDVYTEGNSLFSKKTMILTDMSFLLCLCKAGEGMRCYSIILLLCLYIFLNFSTSCVLFKSFLCFFFPVDGCEMLFCLCIKVILLTQTQLWPVRSHSGFLVHVSVVWQHSWLCYTTMQFYIVTVS